MFNLRRKALYSLLNRYDFGPSGDLDHRDGLEKGHALRGSRLPRWQSWLLTTAGLLLLLLASFRLGRLSSPSTTFDLLQQPRLDESDLGLRPNTLYPKPLGKKVLMLDIDTRPWNIEASLNKQSQLAWGRLNHYLYAKLHGYDYQFIQADPSRDRHNSWAKVTELHRLVQEQKSSPSPYRFIVFTDLDVVFPHLNLPLETLLSHWNITPTTVLAGSLDPPIARNGDIHNRTNINTGFLILQPSAPSALPLMQDWLDCPSDTKFAYCGQWNDHGFHEQSALSNYVRYEYPDAVREIECGEANGIPKSSLPDPGRRKGKGQKCQGRYVRHYSEEKHLVKQAVWEATAQVYTPAVWKELNEGLKQGDLLTQHAAELETIDEVMTEDHSDIEMVNEVVTDEVGEQGDALDLEAEQIDGHSE